MKKFIKPVLSLSLAALMSVSTIGALSVSAAEPTPTNGGKAFFANNKHWTDIKITGYRSYQNADGKEVKVSGEVLPVKVGTTHYDANKHYSKDGNDTDKCDVYVLPVSEYDHFVFEGKNANNGQKETSTNESSSLLSYNFRNTIFSLNDNNTIQAATDNSKEDGFSEAMITPITK